MARQLQHYLLLLVDFYCSQFKTRYLMMRFTHQLGHQWTRESDRRARCGVHILRSCAQVSIADLENFRLATCAWRVDLNRQTRAPMRPKNEKDRTPHTKAQTVSRVNLELPSSSPNRDLLTSRLRSTERSSRDQRANQRTNDSLHTPYASKFHQESWSTRQFSFVDLLSPSFGTSIQGLTAENLKSQGASRVRRLKLAVRDDLDRRNLE